MTSTTATGLILTACVALSPLAGAVQTPENPSTPATAQQTRRSAPLQHLDTAERLLSAIPLESLKLKKDARKKFSDLRADVAGLVSAYQANGDSFVPPAVTQEADVKTEKESTPANWKMYFSEIEHDLTGFLGGSSALPPSAVAGAGSSTPARVGESGIKDLDPEVRRQLEQFRLEVELFFAAATTMSEASR